MKPDAATPLEPTVFVVDDDADLRVGLCLMLEGAGLRTEAYPNGEAFFAGYGEGRPGCLLLDQDMPGMSGAQVQQLLSTWGDEIPVIFLTGHGSVALAVQTVKAGAAEFLEKPVDGNLLLDCVQRALALDGERRDAQGAVAAAKAAYANLSPRECQVMDGLTQGKTNKEIALSLGMSYRTVEVHRAHVLDKMGVRNLAQLTRLSILCKS